MVLFAIKRRTRAMATITSNYKGLLLKGDTL